MVKRLNLGTGSIKASVMVVNGDGAVRGAIADALRDSGYHVVEACSGEGAWRRLDRTAAPAVLVSDTDIGPGMNGLELAATVCRLWPTTDVLLISADAHQFVDGHEFLAKPFSTNCFLKAVAAIAARM